LSRSISNPSSEKAVSSMAGGGMLETAMNADTIVSNSHCALVEKWFEPEVAGEGSRDVGTDTPCPKQFSGVDGVKPLTAGEEKLNGVVALHPS
jgi:hypothetical protein